MKTRPWNWPLLARIPFFVWAAVFLVFPLLMLVRISFATRSPLGEILWDWSGTAYQQLLEPVYSKVFLTTLGFASGNAILCLFLGFPLAFAISRLDPKLRIWAMALLLVPFWTSFLVRLLALMTVLRWQPFGLDLLYQPSGILVAMVYNYLPFAVLPLYAALEKIDKATLEAAQDLGASGFQTLIRVVIPMSQSGIKLALLFVFIPSLGEFLIPELIGGGRHFLIGNFLQNQFLTARNWPLGAAVISLLALLTIAALLIRAPLGRKST
jgi:spermidine/putrescine transport system permease protein